MDEYLNIFEGINYNLFFMSLFAKLFSRKGQIFVEKKENRAVQIYLNRN